MKSFGYMLIISLSQVKFIIDEKRKLSRTNIDNVLNKHTSWASLVKLQLKMFYNIIYKLIYNLMDHMEDNNGRVLFIIYRNREEGKTLKRNL